LTIDGSDVTYGFFFRGGADGVCETEAFLTEDEYILAGRTCLIVSMSAGFIAGAMVTFEWLFMEICCAGVLEGIA
jgi:hypothetical protein